MNVTIPVFTAHRESRGFYKGRALEIISVSQPFSDCKSIFLTTHNVGTLIYSGITTNSGELVLRYGMELAARVMA